MILKKIEKITIESELEFNLCMKNGINPLFWNRFIKMDPSLRVYVQNMIFGNLGLHKGDIVKANDRYYHYCFNYGPLACENCGKSLFSNRNIDSCYSSKYISHILSRSNKPEMAHDPRNHNKLCIECHRKWESPDKKKMLIWMDNQAVIKELKKDYCLV